MAETTESVGPAIVSPVEKEADVHAGFLVTTDFEKLPHWNESDFLAVSTAFATSCKRMSTQPAQSRLSESAPYGGVVADWLPVCQALSNAELDSSEKSRFFFESHFTPFHVGDSSDPSKLTGYFEPELEVRYAPEPGFERAIPAKPSDLVEVDLARFGERFGRGKVWGKVVNERLDLYPQRADIVDEPDRAIAYADPADVFYLQIQGSGRLTFPDGRVLRAGFAAHNSRPFKSIARHLISQGEIDVSEAGMSGVKAWMKRAGPEAAQQAMNINPRYVWFGAQEITDPNIGPKGAQGVPLTPLGSVAIDPSFHPYGVPIFLDTRLPQYAGDWTGAPFRHLVVAQDTGGAIRGLRRGDLFFGWGDDAGGRAASMNHDVDMWVLLPRELANRMMAREQALQDG